MDRKRVIIERMWIQEAERHSKYTDEEWRVIPEFPAYVISNYGQIYSYKSGRLLKPTWTPDGYLQVGLRAEGRSYTFGVHRLVAMAFFGLPEESVEANHIDGDHRNNHISNIEWLTPEQNRTYTREVLRRPERWRRDWEGRKSSE